MPELSLDRFPAVLPLVPAGFGMARAVAEGRGRGRVWADDADAPRRALIVTVEVGLLVGPVGDDRFEAELREVFARLIEERGAFDTDEDEVVLTFHPPEWESRLTGLFGGLDLLSDPRRYLELDLGAPIPGATPAGYERLDVDDAFLTSTEEGPAARIRHWIESHHADRAEFLEDCAATVLTHRGRPPAWSVTDCRSGPAAEIGIATEPEHRRRGLATTAATWTCERLRERGVERVGWHCYAHNEASLRTAARLGFQPVRDYPVRFRMFDPQRHELVRGWCLFELEDEPVAALDHLGPLLASAAEDVDGAWFVLAARAAARAGRVDPVFDLLREATARGWKDVAELADGPEFDEARTDPRWARLLDHEGTADDRPSGQA